MTRRRMKMRAWHTARAKTYPSDMCCFLAKSMCAAIQAQFGPDPGPPPFVLGDDVEPFLVPWDPYYDFRRGRDFAH
eukprot:6108572-Pyramimonas_sp.AAC.1